MSRTLIVGATSAIAEATARLLAARGGSLYLVGRSAEGLDAIGADLRIRGAASVAAQVMDANDMGEHEEMIDRAIAYLGGLDIVLIAHGTLSNQQACERSPETTFAEISTNGFSVIALLTVIANRMEAARHGTIAVISSVAGDRGRASNYVYGSAKALVTTFLSGLRQRLHAAGVHVITIKPGFVDTPMTREFRKGALWAKPHQVARGIVRAIDRGSPVVYLPGFWRLVMLVVKAVPERVFARLRL